MRFFAKIGETARKSKFALKEEIENIRCIITIFFNLS